MARTHIKNSLFLSSSAVILIGTLAANPANADGVKLLQTAEMLDLSSLQPVGGGGVLKRAKQEVRVRLSTSGLDPDAAYTVWWVIFNHPDNCASTPCGESDFGNESVAGAVFYADGFVTGADGTANVTAHLEAGRLPIGTDMLVPGELLPGNGFNAEIHMVIRSHKAIDPGSVGMQTTTFDADCIECEDQQAAVFLAAF